MQTFSKLIKCRADPARRESGRFHVQKVDEEKKLVFGWASVSVTVDGQEVLDLQEDMIDPETLEEAAYKFAELYRDGGEMHERTGVAVMVESVILTAEKQAAIGIPAKSGEYNMFSIGGTAIREEIEDDGQENG